MVFHFFFAAQTRCSILQSKREQLLCISFRLCLPCNKNLLKINFVLHNVLPHTCLVYFAPLISMYNIPSLVKILHSHISLCTQSEKYLMGHEKLIRRNWERPIPDPIVRQLLLFVIYGFQVPSEQEGFEEDQYLTSDCCACCRLNVVTNVFSIK